MDYLFGTGTHAGRDSAVMPQMMMLDLDLPKIDGLEVLSRVRSNERTRRFPVMVLTSSGVAPKVALEPKLALLNQNPFGIESSKTAF